jgi:hypothetical protein
MDTLSGDRTPADYLEQFYRDYQLGEDGGTALPYVLIKFSSFFNVYIPNWGNRRKAVLRHDIHHILTGYKSVLLGEFEIAAWEIASGCMNYWAAYLLNSGGLLMGMLFYPVPTFRAFIRGCRSSNLYIVALSDDKMKNTSLQELKKLIKLDTTDDAHPNVSEIGKLMAHCLLCTIINFLVLVFAPLIVLYNVWMYGKKTIGIPLK